MILILKRLDEATRVPDIESFLEPALQGGFLKKSGRIESLKILMFQQPGSDNVEYHALVRIEPDVVAKRAIKILNRKRCNGKPINVAEYHFRHRDNDRRQDGHHRLQHDRRKADRRRKGLQIKDITQERKGYRIDYSLLSLKQ